MPAAPTFSGQKVLVTGASGFIGAHLCRSLHGNSAEVHGVSRNICSGDEDYVHWWQGDLSNVETVRNILSVAKPDVIFHLASHVVGSRNIDVVLPVFHSNLLTTVNLLTAAAEIGCGRIILAGSLEEPESGDAGIVPCSPYAAAKWAGSAYARMFHALYKTPAVIARLFMVYGPGQKDLNKLVPYVTLSLLRGQAPKLSSGQREVDWVYVADVVDGLITIARAPNVEGSTIDLGSGKLTTIRAVVQHIEELVPAQVEPLFGALPDRPLEQVRAADAAKTYDAIGWKPATPLETGLRHTVNWYREKLRAQQIAH